MLSIVGRRADDEDDGDDDPCAFLQLAEIKITEYAVSSPLEFDIYPRSL